MFKKNCKKWIKIFDDSKVFQPNWSIHEFISQNSSQSEEISDQTLLKLQNLSKVELKVEEIPNFKKDLQQILRFLSLIKQIQTDIPPMYTPNQFSLQLQEDQVTEKNNQKDLMNQTSTKKGNFYKVPKIIEQ